MTQTATSKFTGADRKTPQGIAGPVRRAISIYGYWGALARFILIKVDERDFIEANTLHSDRAQRARIIRQFSRIQRSIPCAHFPSEFVEMARCILNLDVKGPMVECGCFKGGSTAKLSLLAKAAGRRLYVCDSFQGLPAPESPEELLLEGSKTTPYKLAPGQYHGSLEEVRENVRRYGSLDVCEFVPGFFEHSLAGLDVKPSFVFMDVDFASSARACLEHLWPRLAPGGYWFTHEASYLKFVGDTFSSEWWMGKFGEPAPLVIGAGSGLSSISPSIAWFRKTAQ